MLSCAFALFFKTTGSIFFDSSFTTSFAKSQKNKRRKKELKKIKIKESQAAAQEAHSNKREGRKIKDH